MMEVEITDHQGWEGAILKQSNRGDGAKECSREGKIIGVSNPKTSEL